MFLITLQICTLILSVATKTCEKDFDIKLNTIILTHESEKTGAAFLHKLSADSLEECVKYCCDSTECSVGVFGSKNVDTCFLFNCHEPNVCNFTTKTGYTVFIQRDSKPVLPKIHKVETFPPGALRGMCGPHNPCVAENTICDSGQCVCKAGFIEKRHKCVPSLCGKPDLQFQCDDGTACIAIYDVCNGISECPDGSDEAFCDKSAFLAPLTSPKPPITKSLVTESKPSETLHKIVSSLPSRNHFPGVSRRLYNSRSDGDSSEVDFDSSSKELPAKTFQIMQSRRSYGDRRGYLSPNHFSTIDMNEPTLIVSEPRRKSFLSSEALNSFIDRPPSHLRTYGSYLPPNFPE
ncbi:unnamed protein product, partial [Hymenolepis diminuta]